MKNTPNTPSPLNQDQRLKKARQLGMWTFFTAATLQMLVLGLIFFSFVFFRYQKIRASQFDSLSDLMPEDQLAASNLYLSMADDWLHGIYLLVPALLVGGIAFMVLMGWMGKQAGQRVGIQGRRYGWVGIATVTLPSILASVVLVATHAIIDDSDWEWRLYDFYLQVMVPMLVFVVVFLVPGMITGILAAFVTRQRFRGWEHAETVYAQNQFPL